MFDQIISCYERIETQVSDTVTHVIFIDTNGKEETVYPFWKQPIAIEYDHHGYEKISKSGDAYPCIRYTPMLAGSMSAKVFSGENCLETYEIDVVPAKNHGPVGVSQKDSRYFECADGTPFIPNGMNMVYPTSSSVSDGTEFGQSAKVAYIGLRQYERWFEKASRNGVNLVRLWVGHSYFNPSTDNAYEYNLVAFSKIDTIVALARKYGMKLKLTLEHFRNFNYSDLAEGNGYDAFISNLFRKRLNVNGEKCMKISQWLLEEKYQTAWLDKVNEFSKRYAGDPAIFAIELWNEMNTIGIGNEYAVYTSAQQLEIVVNWNREMLPKVKKLFPHNLVTNSLGSLGSDRSKEWYDQFCWDKADFWQMHRYLDQGSQDVSCHSDPIEMYQHGIEWLEKMDMPFLVAETGGVDDNHSGPFRYYSWDDDGLILADCVYTPFFLGSCGTGNIWHWDNRYVESKNLYWMYRPFAQLVDGIDVIEEGFVSEDASTKDAHILLLKGKHVTLGYVRNKTAIWTNLHRDLGDVTPVGHIAIPANESDRLELIPIWQEQISAEMENGYAVMENIQYGTFFRIWQE